MAVVDSFWSNVYKLKRFDKYCSYLSTKIIVLLGTIEAKVQEIATALPFSITTVYFVSCMYIKSSKTIIPYLVIFMYLWYYVKSNFRNIHYDIQWR